MAEQICSGVCAQCGRHAQHLWGELGEARCRQCRDPRNGGGIVAAPAPMQVQGQPAAPVVCQPAPHTLGGQRQEDHLFRELGQAARERDEARAALAELRQCKRGNLERRDGRLAYCDGGHDRSAPCEWVEYAPASEMERARRELAEALDVLRRLRDGCWSHLPTDVRERLDERAGGAVSAADALLAQRKGE